MTFPRTPTGADFVLRGLPEKSATGVDVFPLRWKGERTSRKQPDCGEQLIAIKSPFSLIYHDLDQLFNHYAQCRRASRMPHERDHDDDSDSTMAGPGDDAGQKIGKSPVRSSTPASSRVNKAIIVAPLIKSEYG